MSNVELDKLVEDIFSFDSRAKAEQAIDTLVTGHLPEYITRVTIEAFDRRYLPFIAYGHRNHSIVQECKGFNYSVIASSILARVDSPKSMEALLHIHRCVAKSDLKEDGTVRQNGHGDDGPPASALVTGVGAIQWLESNCNGEELEAILIRGHIWGAKVVPEIIRALGAYTSPTTIECLISILRQDKYDTQILEIARNALIGIGAPVVPFAVKWFDAILQDSSGTFRVRTHLRKQLLLVLAELGGDNLMPVIETLSDSDPSIGGAAQNAMLAISARSLSAPDTAGNSNNAAKASQQPTDSKDSDNKAAKQPEHNALVTLQERLCGKFQNISAGLVHESDQLSLSVTIRENQKTCIARVDGTRMSIKGADIFGLPDSLNIDEQVSIISRWIQRNQPTKLSSNSLIPEPAGRPEKLMAQRVSESNPAAQLKLASCRITPKSPQEADVLALTEACLFIKDYISKNNLKAIYEDSNMFSYRVAQELFVASCKILPVDRVKALFHIDNFDSNRFPAQDIRLESMRVALENAIPLLGIGPESMPLVLLLAKLKN